MRFTFSKHLAQFLLRYDSEFRIERFKVKRGRLLQPGESSISGVYLLCTKECGSMLRATPIRELAAMQYDENHRLIYEGVIFRYQDQISESVNE